jgi:heptosyltransferase I
MRIAIVKLSSLGDIVHSMIVLQFIKKYNEEILIDWIVEEGYQELLQFHPDINQVHIINLRKAKKKKSLFVLNKEIKKIRRLSTYDLVIDMQGLIKSAIISKLIPSKKTLGFDKFSARERFASIFYNKTFKCAYKKNVIERNLEIINYALRLNMQTEEIYNKVPFLHSGIKKINIKLSKSKKNIVLIPGASHDSKCYPFSNLAELTKLIDANFFIIWGNKKEEGLARKIKNISPSVNICDKLSLNSLILLISKVDLVIGPDTGPTHIAWAINIPSITLFGPTPGYRNTFETIINRIIESNSTVDPYNIDKKDNSIKNIEVQKILKMSKELLEINKK